MSFKSDLVIDTAKAAIELIPKGAEAARSLIHELTGESERAVAAASNPQSLAMATGTRGLPPGFQDLRGLTHANPEVVKAQQFEANSHSIAYREVPDYQRFPSLGNTYRTDVAVIGGGVAGLSAARNLAAHGLDTLLLDGGTIGSKTSANMMMMTRMPDLEFQPILAAHGEKLFARYVNELKSAHQETIDFARHNAAKMQFVSTDSQKISYTADSPALRHEFDLISKHDKDVEFVTGAGAQQRFDSALSALVVHGEGGIHPRAYTLGLAQQAQFPIFENSKVIGMKIGEPGKPVELLTPNGRIVADRVVFATGGPAPNFEHLNRFLVPIQCFASCAKSNLKLAGNVFDDMDPSFNYFRSLQKDELMFGGAARFLSAGDKAVPYADTLVESMRKIIPQAEAKQQWTGTIFSTAGDGLPILEQHPVHRQLWNISGMGGIGIPNAQMTGRTLGRILGEGSSENLFSAARLQNLKTSELLGPYHIQ
jgi:gamma-glutamylputrescine oxidase